MIKALIGDLFKTEMKTLVNTVNCVGVMGKGIALMFKKRYPEMFDDCLIIFWNGRRYGKRMRKSNAVWLKRFEIWKC